MSESNVAIRLDRKSQGHLALLLKGRLLALGAHCGGDDDDE